MSPTASRRSLTQLPLGAGALLLASSCGGASSPAQDAGPDAGPDDFYYGDRDSGALMKVPKTGGTPILLASVPGEPSDLFYDQATGALYVSLVAQIGSGRFGAIYKVKTTGGELVLVAKTFGIASFGESPLVVDPSGVYFGAGALWTAPK